MSGPPVRFDLRTEPWIPVVGSGSGLSEVGIREVLVRAHELRGIIDPSPLVEVALHRLLLAVLYRIFDGPRSLGEWQRHWSAGRFDAAMIDAYLVGLADRFDLFGRDRPFYQDGTLLISGLRASPIAKLAHERASEGNSALLFDHTLADGMSPAEAARYLAAFQTFQLGGTVTRTPGSSNPSAPSGPSARAAHFWILGATLFGTLMRNLVRYDRASDVPEGTSAMDLPAWERSTAASGATREPTGLVDMLTWQSVRVQLVPPQAACVQAAVIIAGDRLEPGRRLWQVEPTMLAFVPAKSTESGDAYRAVRMSATRSLWRDSTALLASGPGGSSSRPPLVIRWAADLAERGFGDLGDEVLVPLAAAGIDADHAKTLLWRREALALPTRALSDPSIAERVREAVRVAEQVGSMLEADRADLGGSGAHFPRPLARIAIEILGTKDRPPRPKAIRGFIEATGSAARYWGALGDPFASLLFDLASADAHADPGAARGAAAARWADAVRCTARDAFRRGTSGLGSAPRALFAVADGERSFKAGLSRALGAPSNPGEVVKG